MVIVMLGFAMSAVVWRTTSREVTPAAITIVPLFLKTISGRLSASSPSSKVVESIEIGSISVSSVAAPQVAPRSVDSWTV